MSLSDYSDFLSFSVWAGLWVNPMSDPIMLYYRPSTSLCVWYLCQNSLSSPWNSVLLRVLSKVWSGQSNCPRWELLWEWWPGYGKILLENVCTHTQYWVILEDIWKWEETGWDREVAQAFACVTPIHVSSHMWHLDVITVYIHLASCMNISNFPIYFCI